MIEAIVLAGGRGTRLRPLTDTISKPMIEVAGKPCLDYVVSNLQKYGIDFVLVSNEFCETLTAGLLKKYQKDLTDPFIVSNGDTITNVNIKKMFKRLNNVDAVIFSKDNFLHNGGTFIFRKKVLDLVGPKEKLEVPELLERLESFALYDSPESYYFDIGTPEKLEKARQALK